MNTNRKNEPSIQAQREEAEEILAWIAKCHEAGRGVIQLMCDNKPSEITIKPSDMDHALGCMKDIVNDLFYDAEKKALRTLGRDGDI